MNLDPHRLIDESIAHLSQLSIVFLEETAADSALDPLERKTCRQALERIGHLIPTLRAARSARLAPLQINHCPTCAE